jgi:hypothetical protein
MIKLFQTKKSYLTDVINAIEDAKRIATSRDFILNDESLDGTK